MAIAANGGMPINTRVLDNWEISHGSEVTGQFAKHVFVSDGPLWWLGDTIPVPALNSVISVGDVFLVAGIALVVAGFMQDKPSAVFTSLKATST